MVRRSAGGLYITSSSVVNLVDTTFSENSSSGVNSEGGGIYITGFSTLALDNSSIINNYGVHGAVIIARDFNVTLNHTQISSNSGRSIFTAGGCSLTINNSTLSSHSGGSSINISGSSLMLDGSKVEANIGPTAEVLVSGAS